MKAIITQEDGVEPTWEVVDGQQRLTTLFLLHWFVAAKEGRLDQETKDILSKFTYETRRASRMFCKELVEYQPIDWSVSVKHTIINQPWFFTTWKNDPTVHSMLTMLDAIQRKVADYGLEDVWPVLISDEPAIGFHLLPMDQLGLPDELYIKMNSRGKQLTDFEHFKARFAEMLKMSSKSNEFNASVDIKWTELFWSLYKNDNSPDIGARWTPPLCVFLGILQTLRLLEPTVASRKKQKITMSLNSSELFMPKTGMWTPFFPC